MVASALSISLGLRILLDLVEKGPRVYGGVVLGVNFEVLGGPPSLSSKPARPLVVVWQLAALTNAVIVRHHLQRVLYWLAKRDSLVLLLRGVNSRADAAEKILDVPGHDCLHLVEVGVVEGIGGGLGGSLPFVVELVDKLPNVAAEKIGVLVVVLIL